MEDSARLQGPEGCSHDTGNGGGAGYYGRLSAQRKRMVKVWQWQAWHAAEGMDGLLSKAASWSAAYLGGAGAVGGLRPHHLVTSCPDGTAPADGEH